MSIDNFKRVTILPIGSCPAARLYQDFVRGLPHGHTHPPFMMPPSAGIVVCAGARNVLINGSPAARNGDMGFAAWCGGYIPIFEVLTGSSSVFMGGARASRQSIDITMHCFPNPFSKIGLAISAGAMLGSWLYNGSPDMTGFVFALDPQLPEIQTQNGSVKFVQVICITTEELRWIENNSAEAFITLFAQNNPLLVSDVSRSSIVRMA